jgi:hypothetical protein
VAGVAGTKIQNLLGTLRKNSRTRKKRYIYFLRSARPATTASNATNTPMTAQAVVVSTTYVCVTVVAGVCVAATVVGVIT